MLHLAGAQSIFGDRERAVAELVEGLAAWRACGTELLRPMFLVNLAEVCRIAGKCDQAFAALEEAGTMAEQCGEREWDSLIHRARGNLILAASGDADGAEAEYREAIAIAQRQEAKSFELAATMGVCQLLRKRGRSGEAKALLQPLYDWFQEGF